MFDDHGQINPMPATESSSVGGDRPSYETPSSQAMQTRRAKSDRAEASTLVSLFGDKTIEDADATATDGDGKALDCSMAAVAAAAAEVSHRRERGVSKTTSADSIQSSRGSYGASSRRGLSLRPSSGKTTRTTVAVMFLS